MTHSPEHKESNFLTRMARTVVWVIFRSTPCALSGKPSTDMPVPG